ncbi:MAG: hypothetical protein AAGF36_10040 [Pseudomonadota bacterium]
MMLKKMLAILGVAMAMTFGVQTAQAGNQLAVALSGYDTISYHDGAPRGGRSPL